MMTADPNLAIEPKIAVLRRLQQTITQKNLDAVLAFFAPDVEYHYHVGTRPLVGREWVGKFFLKYWANNTNSTWIIDHYAEVDGRLLTEGKEQYVNASGQTVSHPYMGIIEFRDGLIVGWRDYFQMADPNAGK
jgi:limonene-1,2-epoxide hydrolase